MGEHSYTECCLCNGSGLVEIHFKVSTRLAEREP
jgi:hypothetical protein